MVARPPLPVRALLAAAAVLLPVTDAAAQAFGLRGTIGGFPTSPSQNQIVTPRDQVSAPPTEEPQSTVEELAPQRFPEGTPPDTGGPNYGRKRVIPPKLFRPKPKLYRPQGSPPLPLLVPYRGAPGARRVLNPMAPTREPIDPLNPTTIPALIDPVQPSPTTAVIPSPLRAKRTLEELEPFEPVGVRAGEFVVKPFVEASTGYETNPNQVATGVKPSIALQTFGGASLLSDFSSGSVTGNLRGGYTDYPSNPNANRPSVQGVLDGRFDVTRQDTIDTEARFVLTTQQPGSPLLAVPNSVFITNRPLIVSEGATIGGTHLFGRLALSLKGVFDRYQFGDGSQSDGTTYPFSRDNYNDYGVVARAAYEITPGVIPFTEIGADWRVRDNPIDINGYSRDSIGGTARAGATVDLFGYLSGQASGGYLQRHYDDGRLTDLRGPTVDAALTLKATALTTVRVLASTTATETVFGSATGAISRSFSAEISHVFFRRFTLTGLAVYQPNEYQGVNITEQYTTLTLKGAYSLTRDVQLTGSASHLTLKSSLVGRSFNDNVFLLGVRLQR